MKWRSRTWLGKLSSRTIVDTQQMSDVHEYAESARPVSAVRKPHPAQAAELLTKLRACISIDGVLEALASHFTRTSGFKTFRYYRFAPRSETKEARLYSVAGFGYEKDAIARDELVQGCSTGDIDSDDLSSSDKFWCMTLGMPVVVIHDDKSKTPLKAYANHKGPPYILTPDGQSNGSKYEHYKTGLWLDIPLFISSRFVGKLTIDLPGDVIERHKEAEFRRECMDYFDASLVAAPYLEYWVNHHSATRLATLADSLTGLASPADVFRKAIEVLRQIDLFNCRNVDVFTYDQDSFGRKRLVLRATTFADTRPSCDLSSYDLQDDELALTEWSFEASTPLRLSNLLDPEERDAQLSGYMKAEDVPKLSWKEHIQLSHRHDSLMLIPFESANSDFSGVFRFADKLDAPSGFGFSAQDQILAQQACSDFIAPALESSNALFFTNTTASHLASLEQLSEGVVGETEESLIAAMINVFQSALRAMYGSSERHLVLFSRVDDIRSPTSFTLMMPEKVPPSYSVSKSVHDKKQHKMTGTLTKHVLAARGPVRVTDLQKARASRRYREVISGTKSILSTPARFRDTTFGTISVLSTHYDISTIPKLGLLLDILARNAARTLIQEKIHSVNAILSGVRHDINGLFSGLVHHVYCDRNGDPRPLELLSRMLGDSIDAHCRSGPLPAKIFEREFTTVNINDALEDVVDAARLLHRELTEGRDINVTAEGVHARVYRPFLDAIFLNLLSNAIKHSPNSSPISVVGRVESQKLVLRVSNATSPAADTAILRRRSLYRSGMRLDTPLEETSSSRRGLYNVLRFAELHQVQRANGVESGKVKATSEGEKVVVTVQLPVSLRS